MTKHSFLYMNKNMTKYLTKRKRIMKLKYISVWYLEKMYGNKSNSIKVNKDEKPGLQRMILFVEIFANIKQFGI